VHDYFGQLTSALTAHYTFLTVNITFKVRNVLKEQAAKNSDQRVLSAGKFNDKYRRNQTPYINKNLPVRVFL
jgi:hypothetical protein